MPEDVGITNFREFFDELAAVVFQASVNLSMSYPVGSLEKVLDVCGVGPMHFSTKICLEALIGAILSISD